VTLVAAGTTDVTRAVDAAAAALGPWQATTAAEQASTLRRFAHELDCRRAQLAGAVVDDMRKSIRDARGEVDRAVAVVEYLANEPLRPRGEVLAPAAGDVGLQTWHEPLGVVAAITAWNFPVLIPVWKIASALGWGNTVVWKPAELATTCARCVGAAAIDAGIPVGALSIVTGPGRIVGRALVDAPGIAAISFTGSTAVGRAIAAAAAARGTKLQLELGGKNAAIVLADADLDRAAGCIVRAAMLAGGQKCTATSRVLVAAPVHDALIERLVTRASALRLGDPHDDATDLGPMASREQYETVCRYLQLIEQDRLQLACGGRSFETPDGCFIEPTIVSGVAPASRLGREEIFGPVLSVMRVADLDEALGIANDSEFGLSASVFTQSLAQAHHAARGLEVGIVHVNGESTGSEPQAPFGGTKASSSHYRELGASTREFFTSVKSIYTAV
jgi:acyl-CoA reductase-like NAD-dependent aldehyde dehydrogenase